MIKYIVVAGSSHHAAKSYLSAAQKHIAATKNINLIATSRIFKNCSQNTNMNRLFFNRAFALTCSLEPRVFYRELKSIEFKLGRIRAYKNSPRTIDLDVLMAINLKYKSLSFCVPHSQCFARSFFVVCAMEAIMIARWPLPQALTRANSKFGCDYLVPHS